MLAVVAGLPRYQHNGGAFLPYAFGIASNKVADARRAAARHHAEPMDQIPEFGDEDNAPEWSAMNARACGNVLFLACCVDEGVLQPGRFPFLG